MNITKPSNLDATRQMTITLLNGNELECFRGENFIESPVSIHSEETRLVFNEFKESVWLFINNAERIMSDSKMFLTPIYTQSFSPFFKSRPRIGTFLEWWLHYPQYSRDGHGNPIYCISGNPMTGSHACYVIDPDGNSRKVSERTFLSIATSFGKVNSLYKEAKLTCEHYEMQEVIRMLKVN